MKRSRSSSPSASSISDQDQEQLGHDRGRGRSRNRDRDRGRSSSRDGDGATRARSPPPSRLGSGDNSIRPRHMHNEGYDVGVFWDYENVRIPRWCRTADAANAIRSAVIGFGRISERRLYYDSKKVSEQYTDRVNLDLSGFTLVDCPSRGRKETLDKRLIVDILGFAWERAARHIPTCVVLITSDGDYSYTVAKLRDIGVCTVIVHGERTTTADVLLDACDHAMSWIFDVLRRPTLEEGEDDSEGVGGHDFSQRPDTNTSSADQKRQLGSPQQQLASMNSILEGDMSMLPLSREASLSEAREGRHLVFLNCVSAIQMQQLSKQLSQSSDDLGYGTGGEMTEATRNAVQFRWEDCWALDTQVVQLFNSKRGMHGNDPNSFYKQLRKSAVAGQFISVGRQDMVTGDIIDVTAGGVSSIQLQNLRPQQFLRLTPEGRAQMSGEHITGSGSGTDSGSGGFDISTIREG